jgi:hypothetical protein
MPVNITYAPIMWESFQTIMSDFGYEMVSHNPEKTGVVFRIKAGQESDRRASPITIKYPDSFAPDGVTPAYEKDYVIDLIKEMLGQNGHESIAKIIAKRSMNG